ncbi:hypothetical protein E1B28_009749 [Marasmius oreades]|uniref:Alpha/beta hydrolase fold-3 domain-containing protein n=1 Tax=Marasmius oreades TaxID=181124 RepID=A0A9P7UQS5_9AGAR|nr:uncharacterized protein E1B28_009749 [Marasmius oreades]KAG7090648.1 hypothetical protein E1B28_009749 [Marasmius oreades]
MMFFGTLRSWLTVQHINYRNSIRSGYTGWFVSQPNLDSCQSFPGLLSLTPGRQNSESCNMVEYSHLSEIDPEIAPVVGAIPPLVLDKNSINAVRQYLNGVIVPKLQSKFEPFLPQSSEYSVTDHHIDVGEGAKVLARSIVPSTRDGEDSFPLLFWIHGGFAMGNVDMDDYRLRIASVKLRLSIVNCEYRMPPEHQFPTAVDDLTAALKYVASHPDVFSASLKKGFILGGASGGGNAAAVLSWIARDDPFFSDKPVTGQILHVPVVCHYQAYPEKYRSSLLSLEQNKDAPLLTKDNIVKLMEFYNAPPEDPRISPLLLSSHKGLPPAFIQVCGLDPVRDDGLLYEKVLREAGVSTKLEVYPGAPHGFELSFFDVKQAVKCRDDFEKGLQWLIDIGRRS